MQRIPYVDTAVANSKRIDRAELVELRDAHNVNLHSDDDGFEPLDADDEFAGLTVMDAETFFATFCD